jgi:hypothetical protein
LAFDAVTDHQIEVPAPAVAATDEPVRCGRRSARYGGRPRRGKAVASSSLDVRSEMRSLLDSQIGGVLATIRPDGDPHLVFMLCTATEDLDVILVSDPRHEHTDHMDDNPRVAFLVDTRERIAEGPAYFHRLEVRGTAVPVSPDDTDYPTLQRLLLTRNPMMQSFLDRGCRVYRIRPKELTLSRGGEKLQYRPLGVAEGNA